MDKPTPGPWRAFQSSVCAGKGPDLDLICNVRVNRPEAKANALLIAAAPELLEALLQIDGEAPAQPTRDGPTVGFPPSRDPEIDDGNDVVREAFDEGVCRGLAIAAGIARAAIAKATGAS